MKKNRLRFLIPLWMAGFFIACVTVNVYFPAKEVEKKADEIVDDIRQKESVPPSKPGGPQSSLDLFLARLLYQGQAFAQKEATVTNPVIQNLKNQIRDRFPKLIPFFQKGGVGEARNGYLEIREGKGLSPAEKVDIKTLVEAENRDRRALYQEVAKSMNIGSDQLAKVQTIFAQKWQQAAEKGWWVQKEDGGWGPK